MDNQQQPKNNSEWLTQRQKVVHNTKTLFNFYPQTFTTRITKAVLALRGLCTEKQALIYDYYFLKV